MSDHTLPPHSLNAKGTSGRRWRGELPGVSPAVLNVCLITPTVPAARARAITTGIKDVI